MNGWLRYLELKAKSKIGLSYGVVVAGVIATVSVAMTFGFVVFAVFIWLAETFTPLHAALLLGGGFLLIALIAGAVCVISRRRALERAQVALAARGNPALLDPRLLSVGMQIGRTVGWRRLLPLVAVGILAAGLAKEWIGRSRAKEESDDQ